MKLARGGFDPLKVTSDVPTILVPQSLNGGPQWRLNQTPGRRCRQFVHRKVCGKPAVAELNRGMHIHRAPWRIDSWWGYCEDHLYGHVILDGDFYYAREAFPHEVSVGA